MLIKLGGSLITDKGKDRTTRPRTIERLTRELKKIRKSFNRKITVAHGAGSFVGPFLDQKLPVVSFSPNTIEIVVYVGSVFYVIHP